MAGGFESRSKGSKGGIKDRGSVGFMHRCCGITSRRLSRALCARPFFMCRARSTGDCVMVRRIPSDTGPALIVDSRSILDSGTGGCRWGRARRVPSDRGGGRRPCLRPRAKNFARLA